jgi:hypothetical protein
MPAELEADEEDAHQAATASAALQAARVAMQEQRFADAYEAFSTVVELGATELVRAQVRRLPANAACMEVHRGGSLRPGLSPPCV